MRGHLGAMAVAVGCGAVVGLLLFAAIAVAYALISGLWTLIS